MKNNMLDDNLRQQCPGSSKPDASLASHRARFFCSAMTDLTPSAAGGVTSSVDWFLGIPYAEPPTGNRRFKV